MSVLDLSERASSQQVHMDEQSPQALRAEIEERRQDLNESIEQLRVEVRTRLSPERLLVLHPVAIMSILLGGGCLLGWVVRQSVHRAQERRAIAWLARRRQRRGRWAVLGA